MGVGKYQPKGELEFELKSRYAAGMAEPASIFDLEDDDTLQHAVDVARASVTAGRYVEHDAAMAWLDRLSKGEVIPPPSPYRQE